ncbi:carboxypeptidase regulatory-like domain-containing protein [Methylocystis iwaonis]|uniref:carboxypeptidase regulatory-like domain-containing protein n=1 Tax=Methylocystis iwaonis TaxID=2885079 RepID=UPI002E7B3FA3|nr:carboxypeptidase regulatory-like domain-containing protein [Methylocystis iwaonis]
MFLSRLFLFLLPLPLLACNSTSASSPQARFDAAEAAFLDKPGKAAIHGQAFLPDKTGAHVHYAMGEVVRLIPATSYATARLHYYFPGAKFAPASSIPKNDPDPDYVAHTRTTKAGPTGQFKFENVPPGRYYLSTQVIWKPEQSFVTEGGLIYEEATVTGAETKPVEVVISGK